MAGPIMLIVLTIITNVLLAIIFRYFKTFQINLLPAIVINYIVCALMGGWWGETWPTEIFTDPPPWIAYSLTLGCYLIFGFFILAKTIHHYGVGMTSVFQKTSLIITVLYAILFFGENASVFKIAGVLLALLSIYLINRKESTQDRSIVSRAVVLLPVLTFIINGLLESTLFHVEAVGIVHGGDYYFISAMFLCAASLGAVFFAAQYFLGNMMIHWKDVVGGVILGVPNFFSIYFLLAALHAGWGGSVVVPLVNVGIILLSAVVGFLMFREQLTNRRKVGFSLAVAAIILLSWSH